MAKAYRTKEICEKEGIDLDNVPLIDANQIDMTDIFEDLRVHRTCCRMALISTMSIFNIPDAYSRNSDTRDSRDSRDVRNDQVTEFVSPNKSSSGKKRNET